MLYRLRRRLAVSRFNRAIGGALSSAPMPVVDTGFSIVSMVAAGDVPMYVLCMKAFYRRIGSGRLIAIVSERMDRAARDTLLHHFPGLRLEPLEAIATGPCQRGGCWERLLYILDCAAERYVVQVDADVLAIGDDLDEVIDCIRSNTAFTMVDGAFPLAAMPVIAAIARQEDSDYIGDVCERRFEHYPDGARQRYVRGSAALAGFAAGGIGRAAIEAFHATMEGLCGPHRWREWGSEQCASNFAVANSPAARLLPHPAYTSFFPDRPRQGVKLFHFLGSFRFHGGVFEHYARRETAALLGP